MNLSDFDYIYPEALVAQRPLPQRDASKMMVVRRREKAFEHSTFSRFPEYLKEGDILVVNDTKVFPARLIGRRESGGGVEVLLLNKCHPSLCSGSPDRFAGDPSLPPIAQDDNGQSSQDDSEHNARNDRRVWRAIATRKKRLKMGDKIYFCDKLSAEVLENNEDELLIEFHLNALDPRFSAKGGPASGWRGGDDRPFQHLEKLISKVGLPPLPPYIKRKSPADYTDEDRKRYQTVYAKNTGSAAAPTAGFHLTEDIVEKCKNKGVEIVPVTLHVGLDTFSPVREEKIEEHKMHGEEYFIGEGSAKAISRAKKEGRRVIAVGTTSVRALESFCNSPNVFCHPREGGDPEHLISLDSRFRGNGMPSKTSLFIYPGYNFRVVDAILTNFHQPKSTLLMMISAFAGREFILQMYQEAIKSRYRLFSYGDCMLLV